LIGQYLDEYRIERALGRGGMAHVYLALDTRLRRYTALKVIAPMLRTNTDYEQRFEREAQAIAALEHPNIVPVYRFGTDQGMYYLAMKYVEGTDVAWLIDDFRARGAQISLPDVLLVATQIGAALDYAHARRVIHRDVKPGNILIDTEGRAVLTDFGLALHADFGTHGEIFGSPHYMSPEQVNSSKNAVPQSDLYALGVTLFEMLTGTLPFYDGSPLDIAMRQVNEAPPNPSALNPALSPALDAVIQRALAKEISDRYQSGTALSNALKQAIRQARSGPNSRALMRRTIPERVRVYVEAGPLPPETTNPTPFDVPDQAPRRRLPPATPDRAATPAFDDPPGPPRALVPFNQEADDLSLAESLSQFSWGQDSAPEAPEPRPPLPALPDPVLLPAQWPDPAAPRPVRPRSIRNRQDVRHRRRLIAGVAVIIGVFVLLGVGAIFSSVLPSEGRPLNGPGTPSSPAPTRVIRVATGAGTPTLNTPVGQAVPATRQTITPAAPLTGSPVGVASAPSSGSAVQPTATETVPTLTATPILVVTPTTLTLGLRFRTDSWVALVNTSKLTVDVTNLQLRRENDTLPAPKAWGRTMLLPGECLRIYRKDQPPAELPPGCPNPIDLIGDLVDRAYWTAPNVRIWFNPNYSVPMPG
jgi:serine/threonine protein kinase